MRVSRTWFSYVVPVEAVSLFAGAALHLGVSVGGFSEERIIAASIVEATIGAALAVAAFVYYRRREWWLHVMLGAHLLALAGVLLGVSATHLRNGQGDPGNDVFHSVLLITLGTGLVLASLAGGLFTDRRGSQASSQ